MLINKCRLLKENLRSNSKNCHKLLLLIKLCIFIRNFVIKPNSTSSGKIEWSDAGEGGNQ